VACINPYEEEKNTKSHLSKEASFEDSQMDGAKVTYLLGEKGRIIFGSKEGRVSFYNIAKQDLETFVLPQPIMKSVLQIIELPTKISEIRKAIYYVLTKGNLFAINRESH